MESDIFDIVITMINIFLYRRKIFQVDLLALAKFVGFKL